MTGNSDFCQRAPRTIYLLLLQPTGSSRILYSTRYRDKTSHSHARYRNEARLISRFEQNCRLQRRLHDIFLTAILSQDAVQYFKVPHIHHPLYPGVKRVCCTVVHLNLLIIRHLCISSVLLRSRKVDCSTLERHHHFVSGRGEIA